MINTIVVQGSLEMVKFTCISEIVIKWYGNDRFIPVKQFMNIYTHIFKAIDDVKKSWIT